MMARMRPSPAARVKPVCSTIKAASAVFRDQGLEAWVRFTGQRQQPPIHQVTGTGLLIGDGMDDAGWPTPGWPNSSSAHRDGRAGAKCAA